MKQKLNKIPQLLLSELNEREQLLWSLLQELSRFYWRIDKRYKLNKTK